MDGEADFDERVEEELERLHNELPRERPPRGASWCTCSCHHSTAVKHIVACCHPDDPDPFEGLVVKN